MNNNATQHQQNNKINTTRIRVLCSAVEDENSFDRHAVAVLKDGRVVGHVHVAIFAQVVSQPDSSHRPRQQDDGLRKPSEISEKGQDQFPNYFLHAIFYTCSTRTRARTACSLVPRAYRI